MHLYAAESSLTAAEIDGYLDEIYRYCVVYTYAVIMQLLTLDHLPREARHLVSPEEIAMLESTKKPRKFVHFRLQELVLKFRLKTEHYIAIQNLLTAAEVNAATCRRIKVRSSASLVPRLPLALRSLTRSFAHSLFKTQFFPLPFGLSLVATGFIMIWCLLIPFGIPEPTRDNGLAGQISSTWLTGLFVFILNAMLLVIDEGAYFFDRSPTLPLSLTSLTRDSQRPTNWRIPTTLYRCMTRRRQPWAILASWGKTITP